MELYATGFNAWNQLDFGENDPGRNDEPNDLRAFTCILRDRVIRNVEAFLTYTSGIAAFMDPESDVAILTVVYQWKSALVTLLLV